MVVTHGVLLAGLLVGNICLALRYGTSGLPDAASEIGVGVWFACAGLAIWRLRPRSRTGVWTLALGYLIFIGNPHDFAPAPALPGRAFFTVVGAGTVMFAYAVPAHILLGYPSGRVTGRAERVVVAGCFVLASVGGPLLLLTRTIDHSTCTFRCYDSPVQVVADRQLYLGLKTATLACWTLLAVAALFLLVRRAARSTPRQQRILAFAFVAFGVTILLFAGFEIATAVTGAGSGPEGFFYYGSTWAAAFALVVPFCVGLLEERLAFAAVGTLVGQLEQVPASGLEAALARALRDPGLRMVFPTADGLVDISGAPYAPAPGRTPAVTKLGSPPLAVVIHDPALTEHQELFDAAASAARLALENAHLQAEIRGQLAEVRASRQRIAAATDAERRRLERDLHDGAQQRLLGIGLALGALRGQLLSTTGHELMDELDQELHAAIRELRDLAQGIRPAILTDQGLVPALAMLARRASMGVTTDLHIPGRLDPVIEATAYYIVSEALQNVAKHAGHADTRVSAVHEAGRLIVDVRDDGPGGASLEAGTGLRGLVDRVDTVGGILTITSPAGAGTQLRAELPCASSSSTTP